MMGLVEWGHRHKKGHDLRNEHLLRQRRAKESCTNPLKLLSKRWITSTLEQAWQGLERCRIMLQICFWCFEPSLSIFTLAKQLWDYPWKEAFDTHDQCSRFYLCTFSPKGSSNGFVAICPLNKSSCIILHPLHPSRTQSLIKSMVFEFQPCSGVSSLSLHEPFRIDWFLPDRGMCLRRRKVKHL